MTYNIGIKNLTRFYIIIGFERKNKFRTHFLHEPIREECAKTFKQTILQMISKKQMKEIEDHYTMISKGRHFREKQKIHTLNCSQCIIQQLNVYKTL